MSARPLHALRALMLKGRKEEKRAEIRRPLESGKASITPSDVEDAAHGDQAIGAMNAIANDKRILGAGGALPCVAGTIPLSLQGMIRCAYDSTKLSVDATLSGNRKLVLQAAMAHPAHRDFDVIEKVIEELFEAHKGLMPNFQSIEGACIMNQQDRPALAINGGPKAIAEPWPKRALFGEAEKAAAVALFDKAIASGDAFGYDGPEEEAYCREFAEFMGGGYADGVNSGTAAVYVALRALEIEPFTEVIVPPLTDAGGFMPVPLINCIPVVADAAPGTWHIGAEEIAARITERTSAVIVTHIAGLPADMDPIMEVARAHNLPVIEDCAQAHGAMYKGRMVGAIGDIAAFSTMSGKHHATGAQGGLVFTRNEDMYWRARRYSDRGKPYGLEDWTRPTSNVACSLNLNSNDLAACIGRVQLKKLPGIIERRQRFALELAQACEALQAVSVETGLPDTEGAFWFLILRLALDKLTVDKETFAAALAAEGLGVNANYFHLHTRARWRREKKVFGHSGYPWASPLYTGNPDQEYPVPNVEAAHRAMFYMPIHENLTNREVEQAVKALRKVEEAFLK